MRPATPSGPWSSAGRKQASSIWRRARLSRDWRRRRVVRRGVRRHRPNHLPQGVRDPFHVRIVPGPQTVPARGNGVGLTIRAVSEVLPAGVIDPVPAVGPVHEIGEQWFPEIPVERPVHQLVGKAGHVFSFRERLARRGPVVVQRVKHEREPPAVADVPSRPLWPPSGHRPSGTSRRHTRCGHNRDGRPRHPDRSSSRWRAFRRSPSEDSR